MRQGDFVLCNPQKQWGCEGLPEVRSARLAVARAGSRAQTTGRPVVVMQVVAIVEPGEGRWPEQTPRLDTEDDGYPD
jgi:hypothetical protein